MNFLAISPSSSSLLSLPQPVRVNAAEISTPPLPREIRVCTNTSCRRRGSIEILQVLTGIAPPDVTVKSCGCLGRCGVGPTAVVLPGPLFVSHCGTAARAAGLMSEVCGGELGTWSKSLEALALRKRAEDEMGKFNFSRAENLLSQAINLKPFGGIHILYKDRSAARIAMSKLTEALEDAEEALALAPNYPEAYICQGDAFMAIENFNGAEESYSIALELDPSIRRSKSFKARIAKLQEKLVAADLP